MAELNRANRQVCDVHINDLKTMAPFMEFENANTTTAGLSGSSVYAMAKGSRKIAFHDPLEGTMSIEAQVYPFKFFSLLSDGTMQSDAIYPQHVSLTATESGKIGLAAKNGTIMADSVFVYPAGEYGEESKAIAGTFADGVFTASETSQIVSGTKYEIGMLVSKTSGVKRITFNNAKLPRDYFITMKTLDKDEQGVLVPFRMVAYKAAIQRNFELSFTSEGEPASVTLTFDLMEDKDGNILDMIEIEEEVEISVNPAAMG